MKKLCAEDRMACILSIGVEEVYEAAAGYFQPDNGHRERQAVKKGHTL
jgi:hypothetical protein